MVNYLPCKEAVIRYLLTYDGPDVACMQEAICLVQYMFHMEMDQILMALAHPFFF